MQPNGPEPVLYQFQPYPATPPPPVDWGHALQRALAVSAYMYGQAQPEPRRPLMTPLSMDPTRLPVDRAGAPVLGQPARVTAYDPNPPITRRGPQ